MRLLIVLALSVSIMAAGLVYIHVDNTEQRILGQLQPTQVLVAVTDVEPGTTRAAMAAVTRTIYVPRQSFPEGAATTTSDLPANYVALTRIVAGSFVFKSQFGPASRLVGGLLVPEGKVVFTIDLAKPERVGNFVRPGARVAVYSVDSKGQAALVVSAASVLAIGDDQSPDSTSALSSLVTLAVLADEAKRLIAARQTGTIYFALLGQGLSSNGNDIVSSPTPSSSPSISPSTGPVN